MCGFIPFSTTTAILVNSFTLVSIALDRYFAIVKFVKGTWNPSKLFCTSSTIMIWGIAAALASPSLTVYHIAPIYVMETASHDPNILINLKHENMCTCDRVCCQINRFSSAFILEKLIGPISIFRISSNITIPLCFSLYSYHSLWHSSGYT